MLVDKPVGITSFAVVKKLRWLLRVKKVGHAGTLDPFASGLLILCASRPATRMIPAFMAVDKEYLATLRLGVETDTQDREGEVIRRQAVGQISAEVLEACLAAFRGRQLQVPPAYSALKHQGKPLYHYARKGILVEKEARPVEITLLQRTDGSTDLCGLEAEIGLRVVCSKGTYIRTLAADIGRRLGCGAHLVQLRRVRCGPFRVEEALTWEMLSGEKGQERCLEQLIAVSEISKLLQ